MNYSESLKYLLSLGFERSVKKFGLENTTILLDALGNPQNNFLKVQIAGTNGKGSTCAFLESICLAAGIKTGMNTSPHLVSVTERVRINGVDISEEKFAEYATRVRVAGESLVESGKLPSLPTFFEHVTAIAQLVFSDEGVEIAILEVGLGGRFDATTATLPEIVAITPIAMDHVKTLGPTLVDIAGEKAAVIRSDNRAFASPQTADVEKVILSKCIESGVEVVWATPITKGTHPDVITFTGGISKYNTRLVGMPGKHQLINATLAIYLAETLADFHFEISKKNIEQGLETTKHAGRLEFSDGILFDGAHNESGAEALRDYLSENVSEPITMIFGSSSGKNIEQIGSLLFPLAEKLILTTSENPRAVDAREFLETANNHNEKVNLCETVKEALSLGRDIAGEGLLVVTGSLYLIGEVKAMIRDSEVQRRKKLKTVN